MLATTEREKAATLNELFGNLYLKDVVERNKIATPAHLDNVMRFLFSSVGSLTNPSKLAKALRNQGADGQCIP